MNIIRRSLLAFYILIILCITVFSRQQGTEHIIKPLFWELSRGAWRDISLNILLFVPLGILLGRWKYIVLGCLFSILIELTQYVFCLGFCELDDILNNTIGTAIGILISVVFIKLFRRIKANSNDTMLDN